MFKSLQKFQLEKRKNATYKSNSVFLIAQKSPCTQMFELTHQGCRKQSLPKFAESCFIGQRIGLYKLKGYRVKFIES